MPAVSKQQQRLFGLALSVKDIVDNMSKKKIEKYAGIKHKGLPSKVEQFIREIIRTELSEINISYTKPDFDFEWNEASRYPELKKLGKEAWLKVAVQGKLSRYSLIKNKLSNVDLNFDGLEEPKKKRFINAFNKKRIEMPIAVKFSNNDYDLVAGNTRLSGLIKNGIDPKIWIVDISNANTL